LNQKINYDVLSARECEDVTLTESVSTGAPSAPRQNDMTFIGAEFDGKIAK
jgi:hypothetical protein